jgi:indolepyruvate ferredoxin oxidoreductase beta subunit
VSASGLVTLLVPAVGGQGGGVLSEWIVEAAAAAGVRAHGTSIPGVAQRTGSTSYYVELYTGEGEEPAFSLYPVPGALDVLLAPELMETGRAIEQGFVSPGRTTVITSTHRLYSIHEKIATGRAIYPAEALLAAARATARAVVALDALAVAREHGTEANAVLLGALAGSGAVPIAADAFRAAIERKGVQVQANLAGFDVGVDLVRGGAPPPAPAARAAGPPPGAEAFAAELEAVPGPLRPLVAQALVRLVDYQDRAYAERYLERLRPFLHGDPDVAAPVARHLAVWMTYEDAIRVAQLKTRAARFERIRRDARAPGAEVVVTDFLKPDLDEIWGILPRGLVAPFVRWAERRWPHGRPTLGQLVRTTTVSGYLRLWLVARLRRLRPRSHRAHEEHARMARWLEAVAWAAARDPALAVEVAQAAQLVKGYGDVRRRMVALVDDLLARARRAAELEAPAGAPGTAAALARRYRALVLQGPDAEARAAALAAAVVTALEAGDAAAARAALAAA